MVTDKDRESASEIIAIVASQFLSGNSHGMQDRITEKLATHRAESAEQALKEAADRLCKFLIDEKCYFVLRGKTTTESDIHAILTPLQNVGNDEQVPTERNTCDWKKDNDGIYGTECGGAWVFDVGTPEDNKAVYCPMCGKVIKEIQG